jgi:hypothetical protein
MAQRNKEDVCERIVRQHLLSAGYTDIEREPYPNNPPDFLVNRQIAVEVRRLNENERTPIGHRGLEETRIPIIRHVERLLSSLGPPTEGASWFVWYSLNRPVAVRHRLKRAMHEALLGFKEQPVHRRTKIDVQGIVKMEIFPASDVHPTFFVLGGSADGGAGGFVLSEIERNLRICVDQKTAKIERVRYRYPEWWLALVDYIGYGLEIRDQDELRKIVRLEHSWDKIIIINPTNPQKSFAL